VGLEGWTCILSTIGIIWNRRPAQGVFMRHLAFLVVAALSVSSVAVGCKDDSNSGPLSGLAPDFALKDVNSNSATHDSTISPRDYLSKVSAWYFGHAT
jgi:hypothetical protein